MVVDQCMMSTVMFRLAEVHCDSCRDVVGQFTIDILSLMTSGLVCVSKADNNHQPHVYIDNIHVVNLAYYMYCVHCIVLFIQCHVLCICILCW